MGVNSELQGSGSTKTRDEAMDTLQRTLSTLTMTTENDDEDNDLTPTASKDETAIIFGDHSRNYDEPEKQIEGITYEDCKPIHIHQSINNRDGFRFAVHFKGCRLGMLNLDNCILINVTFNDCKFYDATFSNIFMRDVTMTGCYFEDFKWQNGRCENDEIFEMRREHVTDMGEVIPEEIADPQWLEDELDGTNETKRAIEGGKIDDVQAQSPPVLPFDNSDYNAWKIGEWEKSAMSASGEKKEWWQW